MKKILITGVAGLVGSNLAHSLKSNYSVVGIDNLIGGYIDNIPSDIEFFEMDVADISVDMLHGVDVVVHAACTPHEGLSVFSPSLITRNTFGISVKYIQSLNFEFKGVNF